MNPFFKSAMRILLLMAFLLGVAWVSMKMMQGDLDLEALLQKSQGWLERLQEKVLRPAGDYFGPKLNELVRWARGIVQQRG